MKNWRDVSLAEFEAFLRDYPRPLETRPPLSQRKVNFRAWLDGSLGEWPDNAVANGRTWTDWTVSRPQRQRRHRDGVFVSADSSAPRAAWALRPPPPRQAFLPHFEHRIRGASLVTPCDSSRRTNHN